MGQATMERPIARLATSLAAWALIFTGAVAAREAPAQSYDWSNATLGAGGFAPNIVFSRADPGLA